MNRRLVVTILSCAALVFACAPRTRTIPTDNETQRAPTREPAANGIVFTLSDTSVAQKTSFTLALTNQGKRTEVRFTSGKTHDFVVFDDKDREVWRWSAGRIFTSALQTRQLKSGDVLRFDATWENAKPGNYRLVAQLNSDTNPEQLEREFIVR